MTVVFVVWLIYCLFNVGTMNPLPEPPTNDELQEFTYILNIHKHLVKYLGELFNGADYSLHDNSKFSEPELIPYTLRFIRKLKGDQNPKWKEAKNHHFQNNDHHIEYWKYHNKDMPMDRLSEAVVDMMAAKFQYQLHPEIVEIVRIDGYTIDYEKLVEGLREYLKKPEMYFFLDTFLDEYNEDQKRIIAAKLKEFNVKFNGDRSEL